MALGAAWRHAGGVEYDETYPRKRRYIILAVLAVLLVVGALAARPAYHAFKHWRALQLVQASEQALQAKDLASAQEKAGAAMRLWPDDGRILRQEAKVLLIGNPADSLPYWIAVWKVSHDPADLRQVVDLAIATQNFPTAFEYYTDLQKLDPNNPATWFLEGKIRLSQNQIPEALADFKKVLATGSAPSDAHLYYASAAELSSDPAERAAGLEHLQSLAHRTDDLGLQALRALATYPGQPPENIEPLADMLQQHPLATRDDKLLALKLRSLLPNADEDSAIKAARDLFPGNDNDALAAVGAWLITQNKNSAVLKLIDEESALKREDLFLIRAGAMAGLGQWDALEKLLQRPNLPMPKELQLLFEARTETALGHGPAADLAWESIRNAVADQPAKLLDVAQYAVKLGLDDVARPALKQLTSDPQYRRAAYNELVMLEHRAHDTAALRQTLEDMAHFYPNDPVVENDLLYIGFLRGETGPDKIAAARDIQNKNPGYLSFRITLALGLLEAKQPADALGALADVAQSTWPLPYAHDQGNDWNAVYEGILRANGQLDRANAIDTAIKPAELLPEETDLLRIPLKPGTLGG
jgi:hypothetical protein